MDEEPDWRPPRMVSVGVSVEGPTEERFIKIVLAPYLRGKGIFLKPISMNGSIGVDRIRSELQKMAYDYDYVTTFYDFYGFKNLVVKESKQSLEQKIKQHAHDSIQQKLIPYVQMYEYEGLLFTCPTAIKNALTSKDRKTDIEHWANKICSNFNNEPEKINNSPQTAPSKRLEAQTNYKKIIHGPNIAKEIGIERIRQKCPNFNEWVANLEKLNDPFS